MELLVRATWQGHFVEASAAPSGTSLKDAVDTVVRRLAKARPR